MDYEKRPMKNFNQLNEAQAERLAILQEENAEVIVMASKTERHGYESTHPDYNMVSNRENLEKEIGHVLAVIDMMLFAGDISREKIEIARQAKKQKMMQFLHHQGPYDAFLRGADV